MTKEHKDESISSSKIFSKNKKIITWELVAVTIAVLPLILIFSLPVVSPPRLLDTFKVIIAVSIAFVSSARLFRKGSPGMDTVGLAGVTLYGIVILFFLIMGILGRIN